MTLNLSSEHRQRVIKIIEWLRFGINENLSRGINAPPFLEEPGGKLCSDAKSGDRISAASLKRMLAPLSGTAARGNENKVSELSKSGSGDRATGRRGATITIRPASQSPRRSRRPVAPYPCLPPRRALRPSGYSSA